MADPLTLLRQFNINKKSIAERDDQIIFDGISFLKTAKTNYVICRTAPKEYYTLEALLFLLNNVRLSHPIYVQRAGAAKVPVVRFPDRKDLLAYLNGERDTTPSIDKSAPLELPLQRTASISGIKRSGDDGMSDGFKKQKIDDGQVRPDIQEWLREKLGSKKEVSVTTDQLKNDGESGLNKVMSIEKIAEIKRKIMTRKRGTIKGDRDQDDQLMEPTTVGEQTATTFVMDTDSDVTKDIISRERLLRTRTSILQSSGKQFLKNVLAILQSVKAQEEGKGQQQQQQPTPQQPAQKLPVQEPPKKVSQPIVQYNRYDQERFDSQKETGEFKIDTTATFHGLSIQHVKEGKSQRRSMPSPSPHTQGSKSPRHSSSSQKSNLPQKRESKTPIIVVPAGTTSLISLFNARELLQEFRFVTTEEKKALGVIRENEALVQRKRDVVINGQPQTVSIPFRIVDQPLKLQQNEWNRVVAVFVQGPAWQFKGWPWLLPDGSPVDIFTKVKAFHIKFDDMKTDPNVQKWDVHVLSISRNRRHMDRACVLKIWEVLDNFYTNRLVCEQRPASQRLPNIVMGKNRVNSLYTKYE